MYLCPTSRNRLVGSIRAYVSEQSTDGEVSHIGINEQTEHVGGLETWECRTDTERLFRWS